MGDRELLRTRLLQAVEFHEHVNDTSVGAIIASGRVAIRTNIVSANRELLRKLDCFKQSSFPARHGASYRGQKLLHRWRWQ